MTQLLTAIHQLTGTRNQKATWKPVFHCTAEGRPASPTLDWTPQAQDWQEIPSSSPRGTCHAGYTVRAPPGSLAGGLRDTRTEPFKTNGKISSKPLEKIKTLEGANSLTVQILSYSFRNQALHLETHLYKLREHLPGLMSPYEDSRTADTTQTAAYTLASHEPPASSQVYFQPPVRQGAAPLTLGQEPILQTESLVEPKVAP